MKQLFNTKLRIILVIAVLVTAGLSVLSGLTNQSIPDLLVQGALTPFRAVATSLTNTVERYYCWTPRCKSPPRFPPPATMELCPAVISGAMTSCCE